MTVQKLVEVTKVHGYTCPVCEWHFTTDDGEDRDKPMEGTYFDTEEFYRDDCGDIFIKDGPKILKGEVIHTCHRVMDDGDYNWCRIDMSTFTPTECWGWRCDGCGVESWYDNDRCTSHPYGKEGGSEYAKAAVIAGCHCSKPTAPAEGPLPEVAVGAQVRVKKERPLSANLHVGDIVTVTGIRATGRLTVQDSDGTGWTVDRIHVEPYMSAPPDPRPPVGSTVRITRNNADGVDWQVGEEVKVMAWHDAPDYLRVQRANGSTWNLNNGFCEVVPDIPDEIAEKFIPKTGEKKVTVLDF